MHLGSLLEYDKIYYKKVCFHWIMNIKSIYKDFSSKTLNSVNTGKECQLATLKAAFKLKLTIWVFWT